MTMKKKTSLFYTEIGFGKNSDKYVLGCRKLNTIRSSVSDQNE